MRSSLALLALLAVACGGSGPTVTTPPPPPPPPPGTTVELTVGIGGGTVTVNQSGSPINGLQLTLPSGSYAAQKTVTVSYVAATSIVAPAGSTVISPLITVSGLEARATKDLTLKIPVVVAAGTTPAVVLRDPTSGAITPVTLLTWDATSVTVTLQRINGPAIPTHPQNIVVPVASLQTPATADHAHGGLSAALQAGDGPGQVYVIAIPDAEIFKARSSQFSPPDDAWDFEETPTIHTPITRNGMVSTALFWYMNIKELAGSLKSKKFMATNVGHVPLSSWRAMRLVSLASDAGFTEHFPLQVEYDLQKDVEWRNIASNMIVSSNKPIPVWLFSSDGDVLPVLVTSIGSTVMLTYDPTVGNGAQGALLFSTDHRFLGYASTPAEANPGRWNKVWAHAAYSFYDEKLMSALMTEVTSPTFANDRWPATVLRSQFDTVGRIGDTVWVADTLSIWSHCVACVGKGVPATFGPDPAPPGNEVLPSWLYYMETPTSATATPALPATLPNLKGGLRLNNALPYPTSGFFISFGVCGESGATYNCWIDSRSMSYLLHAQLVLVPPAEVTVGLPATFTVSGALLPDKAEFEWDWGDNTGVYNSTTFKTADHGYATAGLRHITVKAKHPVTRQIVAEATADVQVAGPLQAWKFTSSSVSIVSVGDRTNGYDGRFKADSTILARISLGETQGGFRIVDQAFTPTSGPLRTAPAGLYLLEGAVLTLANLKDPTTQSVFSVSTFPDASLTIAAAPQVSGWNLVQAGAAVNPLCNVYEDTYNLSGTVTNGHLTGLRVPLCVQSLVLPSINGQRLMSMAADVSFGPTTASGTINVIYYFYGNGSAGQFFQRSVQLTFSATRLQ